MRDEHVIDAHQFVERQLADTGAGVDQDVVVDKHSRGAQMVPADAATAAENPNFHAIS